MKRFKITDQREFESRQQCLAFGDACRFVAELAAQVKASLGSWWKRVRPVAPKPIVKAWRQLMIEGDDFHQVVMAF